MHFCTRNGQKDEIFFFQIFSTQVGSQYQPDDPRFFEPWGQSINYVTFGSLLCQTPITFGGSFTVLGTLLILVWVSVWFTPTPITF